MGDVPADAPVQKRGSKYARIVKALLALPPNEVIRVSTGDMKQLAMFRTELRRVAKRSTPRTVNAKRDADGKNLWVWLEPVAVPVVYVPEAAVNLSVVEASQTLCRV